jgi:hypothetical protein
MNNETLLEEYSLFLSEKGLWNAFIEAMKKKGYTEDL